MSVSLSGITRRTFRSSGTANMPGNAFVYGTLMADEVVRVLIRRAPKSKPAVLKGHTRYAIKNRVYPAVVPTTPESRVQGKVLLDLTDDELRVLDVYESVEYYRATVQPELEDGTKVTADVYLWKDEYKEILDLKEWNYDRWRHSNLGRWVSRLKPEESHPREP